MKNIIIITYTLFCIICMSNCSMQEIKTFDEEVYGQKPPGTTPKEFEPKFDFINNGIPEEFDFSSNFMEFVYTIQDTFNNKRIIYYTQRNKGNWKTPEKAYFVPNKGIGANPKFSPDGKFISYSCDGDLWRAKKDGNKWAVAEKMLEPISTDKYECAISFSKSGSVYFAGKGRPDTKGSDCDIYFANYNGAGFDSTFYLDSLNTFSSECVVSVAPNEDYIVFTRYMSNRSVDLHISFRKNNGTWTKAQNLGPNINSLGVNNSARFTNDGKYFFFKQRIWSEKSDKPEIKHYWINTKYFDDMRDTVFRTN